MIILFFKGDEKNHPNYLYDVPGGASKINLHMPFKYTQIYGPRLANPTSCSSYKAESLDDSFIHSFSYVL